MNIDNHKSINLVEMQGMDALHNVSNIFSCYQKGNIKLLNADCMEVMKLIPENYFDLAIVDVPYGIGEADGRCRTRKKHNNRVKHNAKDWDKQRPEKQYFKELFRVSKNQIIWGANYLTEFLPPSMGWIFWDKKIGGDFSDGELAFTSYQKALKKVTKWSGNNGIARIHPTQKPIELYNFCFDYAKATKDFKVLDTHGGSFSSAIAAYYFGFSEFIGCEIDAEYFEKSVKRFEVETMQQSFSFDCC